MADVGKRGYSWGPNTWRDYPADYEAVLRIHCMRFVAQLEIGEEDAKKGTNHLQFFVTFKNAKTFSAVCKIFPGAFVQPNHNVYAARNYCSKGPTSIEGTLIHQGMDKWIREPTRDPLGGPDIVLRPWQQEVMNILETDPDDRTIHWYWEPTGNVGKSALTKHIVLKYRNEVLPIGGKGADMMHLVTGFVNSNAKLRAVLMDLSRSREQYVSYEGIESIKNGLIINTKYETMVKDFNPPHIIVFSNWEPNLSALSADRWRIVRIE